MSASTDLVTRYYRALSNADWDAYDDLVAVDAPLVFSGGVEASGPDGMRRFDQIWKNACPNFTLTPRQFVDGGVSVACEVHYSGTHLDVLTLPEADIPPTGKDIDGDGVALFEIVDGRITSQRVYVDRLDLMQQLGLLPDTATADA